MEPSQFAKCNFHACSLCVALISAGVVVLGTGLPSLLFLPVLALYILFHNSRYRPRAVNQLCLSLCLCQDMVIIDRWLRNKTLLILCFRLFYYRVTLIIIMSYSMFLRQSECYLTY